MTLGENREIFSAVYAELILAYPGLAVPQGYLMSIPITRESHCKILNLSTSFNATPPPPEVDIALPSFFTIFPDCLVFFPVSAHKLLQYGIIAHIDYVILVQKGGKSFIRANKLVIRVCTDFNNKVQI